MRWRSSWHIYVISSWKKLSNFMFEYSFIPHFLLPPLFLNDRYHGRRLTDWRNALSFSFASICVIISIARRRLLRTSEREKKTADWSGERIWNNLAHGSSYGSPPSIDTMSAEGRKKSTPVFTSFKIICRSRVGRIFPSCFSAWKFFRR